jgi:hypothetical protein
VVEEMGHGRLPSYSYVAIATELAVFMNMVNRFFFTRRKIAAARENAARQLGKLPSHCQNGMAARQCARYNSPQI